MVQRISASSHLLVFRPLQLVEEMELCSSHLQTVCRGLVLLHAVQHQPFADA